MRHFNMFKEFKAFAVKGNVMDMAVGIMIGGAFGKIASSLVADVIMPPISLLTGGIDMSGMAITLKRATDTTAAITMNYGTFLYTILDFLIISFSIFIIVRQINKLKKKEEAKPVEPAEEILLLREIRDSLKKEDL